jgi:DNA-binding CsgD family transcriptional regulator
MAIARTDETDLLLPLHHGVHEAVPWTTFLLRLRQRVRADMAGLQVHDGAGGARWLATPTAASPLQVADWQRFRPGRVYGLDSDAFGRTVRVDEPGGASAWMVIRRTARDFTAADGALLAALAPHLTVALQTRAALDRARRNCDVAMLASRRGGIDWIGFDDDGRVLDDAGNAGEAISKQRGHAGIAPAVRACARLGRQQLVLLDRDEGAWMLLVPIDPSDMLASPPARVLGLLRRAGVDGNVERVTTLADMFGLTPSEARLAMALASGDSLDDAATRLGLTIETARNYSKRVFAKTRTRGQADLVRTIIGSVAWLA